MSSRTSKNLLLKWGQDCAAVADSYREELKNKDNEISRYSKAATDIMKAKDKELKKKTAELRKAKAQTLLYKGKAQDEKIEKQSLKKEMNRLQKSISNRDSEIERNKAGHTRELQVRSPQSPIIPKPVKPSQFDLSIKAMKMKLMKAENAAAEAKAKSKKNKSARGTEQGEEKAALMYEKHRLTEERKEAEHRRKIELEQSRRASKKAKFEFANQGGAGCGMHGAPSDFRNMAAPYVSYLRISKHRLFIDLTARIYRARCNTWAWAHLPFLDSADLVTDIRGTHPEILAMEDTAKDLLLV